MAMANDLSLAESGALALDGAAAALDRARDAGTFLDALERNHRLWRALSHIASRQNWPVPNRQQSRFALGTTARTGANDDNVHALVTINRRVSSELVAGGDIERIRERAYFLWESRGRPHGKDLDLWLLAEIEQNG
jgi:hypothetical protein